MEWLVTRNKKTGVMIVQTREQREMFLNDCLNFKWKVPSIVLKTFDTKEQADNYVKNVKNGDNILRKL